ncbi:MAG TPA: tetratricopeptide repeat protein [Gaiellaceae bacterium]|nr:tetratricopeptide repeat protein [Gaiellaceae bacterium]
MSRDLFSDSFGRALALYDLGRLEDAEEALRAALREEPDDPLTYAILSLVLLDLDRGAEALEAASKTIALAPDVPLGHVARAQALVSLGRFDEAEGSAREAIRLDPEDADGWIMLANAHLGRERWDEALSAAEKALSLEPESESARGLRAVALAMSQPGADWQRAAAEALALSPDRSVAHTYAGLAHLVGGSEREAAERFREALRLDPESEVAQAGLADAMKAAHPLYRPIFRFFLWQQRLSRGWRIALVIGPLLLLRTLDASAGGSPLVIALVVVWIVFLAVTWMSVPIANLALRLSPVGRAVLPEDQQRSSMAFLAFVVAALVAVALAFAFNSGFAVTAFACGLLAFAVGSAHGLGRRRKRVVYGGAIAAGILAFVGGALVSVRVGDASLGGIILVAAAISAVALIWTVRLG